MVEVRDTGTGITEMPKIFEPYFTTKSNGFGIGLSVVYATIARHGTIEVTSMWGTAFHIPVAGGSFRGYGARDNHGQWR